jgi:hypothetical protein
VNTSLEVPGTTLLNQQGTSLIGWVTISW